MSSFSAIAASSVVITSVIAAPPFGKFSAAAAAPELLPDVFTVISGSSDELMSTILKI